MKWAKKYLLISLFAIGLNSALCQVKPLGQKTNRIKIDSVLNDFISSPEIAQSEYSIYVKNIEDTNETYNIHGDSLLTPVSILKLLTTSVALDVLGEDFRFKTLIKYDKQNIKNGILEQGLTIIGSGDPTLGSWRFQSNPQKVTDSIVKTIIKSGINKIQGKILVDVSCFKGEIIPKNWKDYDYGNYFGAQANGINLHENSFSITFNPGDTIGKPTTIIASEPKIQKINIINEVLTGPKGSGDNVIVYSHPFDTVATCRGTVPMGVKEFDVDASIPNPPLYFIQELRKSFDRYKIQYDTAIEICYYPAKSGRDTLLVFNSPPLKDIIYHTNLKSINLYAESLIKAVGEKTTEGGSYNSSIPYIKQWLLTNGIKESYIQYDGSGLCPDNRISSKMMVDLLLVDMRKSWFPSLENSLPVAGKTGSISNICKNTVAQGRVKAKSGYMKNVRSYAGYYENLKGEKYAFCLIINNFQSTPSSVKKRIESLFINLVK